MDDATREALERSIKHWQNIVTVTFPGDANITTSACALCSKFCIRAGPEGEDIICDGCPVQERTGYHLCEGTPWRRVYNTKQQWFSYKEYKNEFRKAAQEMLDFLISLRPTSSKETGNAS